MKTPNKDLFELIRSLSKNEKRFFRLFSSLQEGEKNYLRLFDAIEKQNEYDEEAIKNQFKGEKFIRQLTFTKEYLYNSIIRSLHAYGAKASAETRILELIRTARLLYDKALFKQSQKAVNKARELATVHDKYALLLEILDAEKKLHVRQAALLASEKKLEEILNEEILTIDRVSTLCKYWNLHSVLLRASTRNWRPRNEEELKPFDEIIRHPIMREDHPPSGFESQFYFYHIRGMYYYFKRHLSKASEFLQRAVDLLESRPLYIKENPVRYLTARSNVILTLLEVPDYQKAEVLLESLRQDFSRIQIDATVSLRLFINYYCYYQNICLNTGEFQKAMAVTKEVENWLDKNGKLISDEPHMVIAFNFSVLYFTAGDYKQALRWLNRIFTLEGAAQFRIDLNTFLRIFDLIIHFELQNHALIDYKVKSVYRYLYKRRRLYQFETVVLNFIRKYSGIRSKEDELKLFKEYRDILEKLSRDPFEKEALDRFDFIAWLDSKILKKSFLELNLEKIKALNSKTAEAK